MSSFFSNVKQGFRNLRLYHASRRDYVRYRDMVGIRHGKDLRLIGLPNFGSEPWLISIGDHVTISFDVAITTHDGASWVLRDKDEFAHRIRYGRVTIGDNCFIGAKSIIFPNVTIGNNSIVGAGSVVTRDVPENCVYAGNPARFVCTVEEYAAKQRQIPEFDPAAMEASKRDETARIADLTAAMHLTDRRPCPPSHKDE